ncbi:Uncharacterised protein [Mycobacteroides abscessus]|nr:Uncharacterised protein [Mycobacteroides abscessus]
MSPSSARNDGDPDAAASVPPPKEPVPAAGSTSSSTRHTPSAPLGCG